MIEKKLITKFQFETQTKEKTEKFFYEIENEKKILIKNCLKKFLKKALVCMYVTVCSRTTRTTLKTMTQERGKDSDVQLKLQVGPVGIFVRRYVSCPMYSGDV